MTTESFQHSIESIISQRIILMLKEHSLDTAYNKNINTYSIYHRFNYIGGFEFYSRKQEDGCLVFKIELNELTYESGEIEYGKSALPDTIHQFLLSLKSFLEYSTKKKS